MILYCPIEAGGPADSKIRRAFFLQKSAVNVMSTSYDIDINILF